MIITIDIGNSSVSMAKVNLKKITKRVGFDLCGSPMRFKRDFSKALKRIGSQKINSEKIIICSVVPALTKSAITVIKKQLNKKPLVVGKDVKVPLRNNYRNPNEVGQDRLVGAFAAKHLYGEPLIIIDFGTAITLDVVSEKGYYEGGIIVPGIRLTAESLFRKTALLPNIRTIKAPQSLIGKDTRGSILSGMFYGYGAMCLGLIEMLSKGMKKRPKVIITGGYTHLMKRFIAKKIYKIDEDLVFKGMSLLAQK